MENASAPPSSSAAPQAQAQPAQQNITVTNRQLNITPFVIDRDPTNTANRWDKWKKDIERQFRFFGIQDPELKKDGLIIYGGRDIADLEDSLPDVESTDPPADEYTKFIRKLDKHFLPKKKRLREISTWKSTARRRITRQILRSCTRNRQEMRISR